MGFAKTTAIFSPILSIRNTEYNMVFVMINSNFLYTAFIFPGYFPRWSR